MDRKGVKNRQDGLVVLDRVAKVVIEEMRGTHPEHVFSYRGKPVAKWAERPGAKLVKGSVYFSSESTI